MKIKLAPNFWKIVLMLPWFLEILVGFVIAIVLFLPTLGWSLHYYIKLNDKIQGFYQT